MNKNQKMITKGFILGIWIKNNNHLIKSYVCLTAASIYAIRAACAANAKANETLDDLYTERQRPVLELEKP